MTQKFFWFEGRERDAAAFLLMTFFSWPDRIADFLLMRVVEQKVFSMGKGKQGDARWGLGRTKKHWSRQKAQWEGDGGRHSDHSTQHI
jgi:hypothetical protein